MIIINIICISLFLIISAKNKEKKFLYIGLSILNTIVCFLIYIIARKLIPSDDINTKALIALLCVALFILKWQYIKKSKKTYPDAITYSNSNNKILICSLKIIDCALVVGLTWYLMCSITSAYKDKYISNNVEVNDAATKKDKNVHTNKLRTTDQERKKDRLLKIYKSYNNYNDKNYFYLNAIMDQMPAHQLDKIIQNAKTSKIMHKRQILVYVVAKTFLLNNNNHDKDKKVSKAYGMALKYSYMIAINFLEKTSLEDNKISNIIDD
ncbi:hypothetical protein N9A04_00320 [Rickettsiales bacterium]|nr:hypothetical protein [Rickettsiales bacterium]